MSVHDHTTTDSLDRFQVQACLQELTEGLRDRLPSDVADAVGSEEEARVFMADLLKLEHGDVLQARFAIGLDESDLCRELLGLLCRDATYGELAAEVVADPPTEDQLGIDTAPEVLVFLAGVVSLLMTRVRFRVVRKDHRTSFEFDIEKKSVGDTVMRDLLELFRRAFGLK